MSALNPSDLGEDARQDYGGEFPFSEDEYLTNQSETLTNLPKDITSGSDSITMVSQDAFDAVKTVKTIVEKQEAFINPDEEARLLSAPGSDGNSPRDPVSPSAGSSPFSAMESDGEGIETGMDDASLSGMGDTSFQRSNGYFGASTPLEYTTTPCASSSACDDDYESTGSRKKRRKTRRDMHTLYHPLPQMDGTLASLRFARASTQEPWQHDQETSPFSPPTCPKGINFNFAENNNRRGSGAAVANAQSERVEFSDENAKRPRTCDDSVQDDELLNTSNVPVKLEMPTAMDTPVSATKSAVRRHHTHSHHRTTNTTEEEQILLKQYPRKVEHYELKIVTQPEPQHRARYLTEGSRGPVKDGTQRGFPEVQLLGYTGSATLQVFVATDSGKVKPHGFYQACRVTGRNTSPCEEIEIEGTKVIEIPFKQESMVLSIDCVGILKLRNTDVEVRTGIRNPKRNQSVRLAFRVRFPKPNGEDITLQNASSRISCTQPLGQPEITKKSIDRCTVEGGIEMFIIGKNFHRGTKVIYQDPEEPNGTQWCAEGEVDKDTFHQSHMVVRVPPYHDLGISKPVNVQLLVEFQDKRCEPHSFTYTPRQKEPEPPKDEAKKATQAQPNTGASKIESALNILDGAIDKKFLVALFSRLLTDQVDGPITNDSPEPEKPQILNQVPVAHVANLQSPQSVMNAAALPMLQGMLQQTQLQAQTVVGVAAKEPTKSEVNSVNVIPSVPITTSPFGNIQITLQPAKMSLAQDLNSAVVAQTLSNPATLANPVSRINFNPVPAQATTNLLSSVNFTALPAGGPISMPQVLFNPPLPGASTTNLNPQVSPQPVPAPGVSIPISQMNPNPLTRAGLPTSVFPSLGNFAGQNIKVKSETSLPEAMPNLSNTTNIQATLTAAPSNPQVALVEKPQAVVPPPMVVSPVSQPKAEQTPQAPILYNSLSAGHVETQPVFGSASISFVGNSATKADQAPVLSFSNGNVLQVCSQPLHQVTTFTGNCVASASAQQLQTQPAVNFQVSPGQQMQQTVFAMVPANQNSQFSLTSPSIPASCNQGIMVQNASNPGTTFITNQAGMIPDGVQQVTDSFDSSLTDKKPSQFASVQVVGQSAEVNAVQSATVVGSQQLGMPVSKKPAQQQLSNFASGNQQQFNVDAQQSSAQSIQEQPMVNFGIANQQQFTAGVADHPMQQEHQQTIVVSQQKFTVDNPVQQQKSGFDGQAQQQFSITTQEQPMQQILPPARNEIPQQTFPIGVQAQAAHQPRVTQIVQVQQVLQTPANVTLSHRTQDTQMLVDPFVESQNTAANLRSQPTSNTFSNQQAGIQNASIQPMEDVSMAPMPSQTSDHHMKDLSLPQQQQFKIPHQPTPLPVASEAGNAQVFQVQSLAVSSPSAIEVQPIVQGQDFQAIQQPVNGTLVASPEQIVSSPQQVCSQNVPTQSSFQQPPVPQSLATETQNVASMQAQQFQSPEAATKSPPSISAGAQPGFPSIQMQNQQGVANPQQMQMTSNLMFQNNCDAQQQGNANTQPVNSVTLQQQQMLGANLNVSHHLEPGSPDLFVMTQLLQSIDGSSTLETITGEEVQRHCQ